MAAGNKLNQQMKIIEYMKNNNGITSLEAVENLRILRLASRIHELVKLGYDIDKETARPLDQRPVRLYRRLAAQSLAPRQRPSKCQNEEDAQHHQEAHEPNRPVPPRRLRPIIFSP